MKTIHPHETKTNEPKLTREAIRFLMNTEGKIRLPLHLRRREIRRFRRWAFFDL